MSPASNAGTKLYKQSKSWLWAICFVLIGASGCQVHHTGYPPDDAGVEDATTPSDVERDGGGDPSQRDAGQELQRDASVVKDAGVDSGASGDDEECQSYLNINPHQGDPLLVNAAQSEHVLASGFISFDGPDYRLRSMRFRVSGPSVITAARLVVENAPQPSYEATIQPLLDAVELDFKTNLLFSTEATEPSPLFKIVADVDDLAAYDGQEIFVSLESVDVPDSVCDTDLPAFMPAVIGAAASDEQVTCDAGYSGNGSGCADIDECADQTAGCSQGAICENAPGAYTCRCPSGTIDQNHDGTRCSKIKQFDPSTDHTCAVTDAGALYCWGHNADGQLGLGTTANSPSAVRVGAASDWIGVSAGGATCAIRGGSNGAGYMYCWGSNAAGQLGDGTTVGRLEPTRVGVYADWSLVSVGLANACGLRAGALYCWGENSRGQVGDGTTEKRLIPTRIGSAADWTSVAAAAGFACGIRSGALYCWGQNGSGQLGDGTTDDRAVPTRVGDANDWSTVSLGTDHACGIRGGALYCWGSNALGQLGDGTQTDRLTPTSIPSDEPGWSAVAAGGSHTCALYRGSLWCWGSNSSFEIGMTNKDALYLSPNQLSTVQATAIGAGDDYTCAMSADSALSCWGANDSGQQGNERTGPGAESQVTSIR